MRLEIRASNCGSAPNRRHAVPAPRPTQLCFHKCADRHSHRSNRQQHGERLPDTVIPIGCAFAHDDPVASRQDAQPLRVTPRGFATANPGLGTAGDKQSLRQTELQPGLPHLVLNSWRTGSTSSKCIFSGDANVGWLLITWADYPDRDA
jgi:hypothetical protein